MFRPVIHHELSWIDEDGNGHQVFGNADGIHRLFMLLVHERVTLNSADRDIVHRDNENRVVENYPDY